jgi:hypothetical protein
VNEDLAKLMFGDSDSDVVKDYGATSPAVVRERPPAVPARLGGSR